MRAVVFSVVLLGLGACNPESAETGQPSTDDTGSPETCDLQEYWLDGDGDGYGGPYTPTEACEQPSGYAAEPGDCDDADPNVNPGAEEVCNGEDDNCDGIADDGAITTWYEDADDDGYGNPEVVVEDCDAPSGWVADGTDCDDGDAAVHPGAVEECDNDDDDCDGRADVGEVSIWYSDEDGDGYGHPAEYENTCDPPEGWVQQGGDCDPADPDENPGAPEICDLMDQDCDGEIDEDFDLDGDGYVSDVCDYIDASEADCDDDDPDLHPLQAEICDDGIDQDCDGRDTVCGFDGEFDLNYADAKYYSSIVGADLGRLVETGDIDGDGRDDVLSASLYSATVGAYLAYGPLTGTQDFGTAGYELQKNTASCYGGGRSIGIADTDGDGFEDIVIGCPWSSGDPGSRVVFGPVTGDVTLADEVHLYGSYYTYTGHGSDLADVDGDGLADAVIGAYNTNGSAGTVYVSYGPVTADVDLESAADATLESPSPSYYLGRVTRAGGDLNGDGIGDVLGPAPYANVIGYYTGVVYVVHMPVYGTMDISDGDGQWTGESSGANAGNTLAMADVNGDGLSDAVIGAYGTASASFNEGAVYVVFGPATGTSALDSADVAIYGASSGQYLGSGLAADDVDGDGTGDVLAGAYQDNTAGASAGAAYLFYGPLSGTYTSDDAHAVLLGESTGDGAGMGAGIGDLDGDGRADLIVGAIDDNTGGNSAGAIFVQYPE